MQTDSQTHTYKHIDICANTDMDRRGKIARIFVRDLGCADGLGTMALWSRTEKKSAKIAILSLSHKLVSERVSKRVSAAKRASEASSVEQAFE